MRLIDADALKEEINLTSFWDQNDYGMVKNIIDNAPTVELTASFMRQQAEDELIRIRAEADQRGYTRGYQFGFYTGQHTKLPTGEWIEELPSVYYCSRCRSEPFGDNYYNYCPNCGAKMKGAEE